MCLRIFHASPDIFPLLFYFSFFIYSLFIWLSMPGANALNTPLSHHCQLLMLLSGQPHANIVSVQIRKLVVDLLLVLQVAQPGHIEKNRGRNTTLGYPPPFPLRLIFHRLAHSPALLACTGLWKSRERNEGAFLTPPCHVVCLIPVVPGHNHKPSKRRKTELQVTAHALRYVRHGWWSPGRYPGCFSITGSSHAGW